MANLLCRLIASHECICRPFQTDGDQNMNVHDIGHGVMEPHMAAFALVRWVEQVAGVVTTERHGVEGHGASERVLKTQDSE